MANIMRVGGGSSGGSERYVDITNECSIEEVIGLGGPAASTKYYLVIPTEYNLNSIVQFCAKVNGFMEVKTIVCGRYIDSNEQVTHALIINSDDEYEDMGPLTNNFLLSEEMFPGTYALSNVIYDTQT